MKKKLVKILIFLVSIIILIALVFIGINLYMINYANKYIIDEDFNEEVDAVLVLGAYVFPDGDPSWMLKDRLKTGLYFYEKELTDRFLLTGDHGQKTYDEVHGMKNYLLDKGVDENHIFMDHAGFSTHDSMVRADKVFLIDKMIVSTQKYHLYRAIYIARKQGIEAYGISANRHSYPKIAYYKARESIARVKDFFYVLFDKDPVFLGDTIDIRENGLLTEDIID